jgi:hypothetical protein
VLGCNDGTHMRLGYRELRPGDIREMPDCHFRFAGAH